MRLSDLHPADQQTIRDQLGDDLLQWRMGDGQWPKHFAGTSRGQMLGWCRAFIKFYVAVILKDDEIEAAFTKWATAHYRATGLTFFEYTDFMAASSTPLYAHRQFLDCYTNATWRLGRHC